MGAGSRGPGRGSALPPAPGSGAAGDVRSRLVLCSRRLGLLAAPTSQRSRGCDRRLLVHRAVRCAMCWLGPVGRPARSCDSSQAVACRGSRACWERPWPAEAMHELAGCPDSGSGSSAPATLPRSLKARAQPVQGSLPACKAACEGALLLQCSPPWTWTRPPPSTSLATHALRKPSQPWMTSCSRC